MTNITHSIRDLWRQFVLLVAVVVALAVVVIHITQDWRTTLRPQEESEQTEIVPPTDWQQSIESIQENALFGRAMAAPTMTPEQLKMELKGIFMAVQPEQRKVVIQQSGEPEKLFGIGDQLGGMWKIVDIQKGEVTLGAGGKRYPLRMTEPKMQNTNPMLENNGDDEPDELGQSDLIKKIRTGR